MSTHAHPNTFQPLPIEAYLEPAIFAEEEQRLFSRFPRYVGHELMLSQVGDYRVLAGQAGQVLIRSDKDVHLLSNVCSHRQALMLEGHGNIQRLTCPLHRWSYDLDGTLLSAPRFQYKPCLHLPRTPLQSWQGLLFEGSRSVASDLVTLDVAPYFDLSDYILERVLEHDYRFNWKTFIEAYLEDYHVAPFHPGLNAVVDCANLAWQLGSHYSLQHVGYKPLRKNTSSAIYARWHDEIQRYHADRAQPQFGAVWFAYYPLLMIEVYPQTVVISYLIPRDVSTTSNVIEFYYPKDIVDNHPSYIVAQQEAYLETAREDEELCQRMHDGRRALFEKRQNRSGPYQEPLETGLRHFHAWYGENMLWNSCKTRRAV